MDNKLKSIKRLKRVLSEVIIAIENGKEIKDHRGKLFKQEFGVAFIKMLKNELYNKCYSNTTDLDINKYITEAFMMFDYIDSRYECIAAVYGRLKSEFHYECISPRVLLIPKNTDNLLISINNSLTNIFSLEDIMRAIWKLSHYLSYSFFKSVEEVYNDAFDQVQKGKGIKRHGNNKNFFEQNVWTIVKEEKGFARGQARKKILESLRMEGPKKYKELLGAMNYLIFEVLRLENKGEKYTQKVKGG